MNIHKIAHPCDKIKKYCKKWHMRLHMSFLLNTIVTSRVPTSLSEAQLEIKVRSCANNKVYD